MAINQGQSAQCAEIQLLKPLSMEQIMVTHVSVASSKPKFELDSHADMCVLGDNFLGIHDYNRPVNIYSYDPKHGHRNYHDS